MKFLNFKLKILTAFLAVFLVVTWLVFFRGNEISVKKGEAEIAGMNFPESNLSGVRCENGSSRPLAVMLAGDVETRPLSGISEADMVFEMPVTDGGVTRIMAVFQCKWPEEIGSVRSSRTDFIPLAQGLGAIYTHWGGEKEALSQLNNKVIDNIDAMKYDGTIFYRKKGVKPPHNGFTDSELLKKVIGDLEYDFKKSTLAYPHQSQKEEAISVEPPLIYKDEFEVFWKYNSENKTYLRYRGRQAEIDKNSSKQVEAKNVILLKTSWSPVSKDYIRVKTLGSGEMSAFVNGKQVDGSWEKKDAAGKLYFYDSRHEEIKFAPGQIWVEITIGDSPQ